MVKYQGEGVLGKEARHESCKCFFHQIATEESRGVPGTGQLGGSERLASGPMSTTNSMYLISGVVWLVQNKLGCRTDIIMVPVGICRLNGSSLTVWVEIHCMVAEFWYRDWATDVQLQIQNENH